MTIDCRKNVGALLISFLLIIISEVFFFRNVLFTDALIGDSGDGRLTMLFAEHWYHVFSGKSTIQEMGFFFPVKGTLAYSDMLFSFGVIHSLFRVFGFDIFISYKVTILFIHLIGSLLIFVFLHKSLMIDSFWAIFGTIAFSFSSSYAIHLCHTQLVALSFLPALCIAGFGIIKNLKKTVKRRVFLFVFALLLVLLLYTSWYVFFFSVLFGSIFILFFIISCIINNSFKKTFFSEYGFLIPDFLIFGLFLISLMIPFVLSELPLMIASGGKSYSETASMLPEIIDFFNVSIDNLLFGKVLEKMHLELRGYGIEVIEGFSIVLLFVFFVVTIRYVVKTVSTKKLLVIQSTYVIVFSIVFSFILTVRLSSNGISLWYFVYKLFPGGRSIRAVSRFLLFLSFPLSIITAYMGDSVTKARKETNSYKIFMVFLIILLFVSNIQRNGVSSSWNRHESIEFLDSVSEPPSDCEVFYLSNSTNNKGIPLVQLDAYQISDYYGIPTINGYSGLNPIGWDGIWDTNSDSYFSEVGKWIKNNNLKNVYCYNDTAKVWKRHGEHNNHQLN